MPLRATDNALVLPLLGLLIERPRHQYALLGELRARYGRRVRTGSLYTLVASLQETGWIEQARPERHPDGEKAPPVVYGVTRAGREEITRRVAADLLDTDPTDGTRFVTALAYIGLLDREAAIATLTARIEELRHRAREWEASVVESGLPPVLMIEADFVASQTRHDLAWLETFVQRIEDPDYDWPAHPASTG